MTDPVYKNDKPASILRIVIPVLCILVAAVIALVWATSRIMHRNRSRLLAEFSIGQSAHLRDVAQEVERDLNDLADRLLFAARLLATAQTEEGRLHVLHSLLRSSKAYRVVVASGSWGEHVVALRGDGLLATQALRRAFERSARRVMSSTTPKVVVSRIVDSDPDDLYRVFAAAHPTRNPAGPTVVGVLVDLGSVLSELRVLNTGPGSHLLVLGPHGLPTPVSTADVAKIAGTVLSKGSGFAEIDAAFRRMTRGDAGTLIIDTHQTARLGIGDGDLVMAFAPIAIEGGANWAVATFTSMAPLRSHERGVLWLFGSVAALIGFALISLAGYVVFATRKAAILQERVRHANELAHVHELARKALDNIPTGVLTLGVDRRITAANHNLARRLSDSPVEKTVIEVFATADAKRLEGLVDHAMASGQTVSLLKERLDLFAGPGAYNVHAVPLDPASEDARALLVIEDLTAVQLLESQLLRAEKLATVGALAAGIAHEIGTPLGVVRGRAEYILGKLPSDHDQASGLRIIAEQVDRIARTIQALLDFSRIKPGDRVSVDIALLVRKCTQLLAYETERRHISLSMDVADRLPPVIADADQLQQVLVNLLMNAFDACDQGGRVSIRATCAEANRVVHRRHLCLEIVDDGCGIPPQDVHRAFDPFFTTKKPGQGTGLGLTMVAQIIRDHGGHIELRPHEGVGTMAVVRLPTVSPQEEAHAS